MMTAVTAPTIRLSKHASTGRFTFRCTCGRGGAHSKEAVLLRLAQAHSDWHWSRGEHSTVELGGLL